MMFTSASCGMAMLLATSVVAASPPVLPLADAIGFTVRSQLASLEEGEGASAVQMLAWVETSFGVSNVVVSINRTNHPFGSTACSRVTNFTSDDGMEISLFGFYNQKVVHFSKTPTGGANPTHRATPSTGGFYAASTDPSTSGNPADVHVVLVTTLPVEAVVEGKAWWTTLVPRGSVPAGNIGPFPYDAPQLLAVDMSADGYSLAPNAEPQTIFESKHGLITGYAFSPDGKSLAIANDRGDHGFVGVLPLGDKDATVTWISPSVDTDTAPTWSPDGTHLAWRREVTLVDRDGRDPRCTKGGYCGTAGPAYSIMAAKVKVAGSHGPTVVTDVVELHRDWTTGYPDGSAGYGSRPLVWMDNSSGVVFGCEVDGYIKVCAAHLETAASGSMVVAPQPCDHQAFTLRSDLLFTTNNCDMVDSLGIDRIDLPTLRRTVIQPAKAHVVSGMSSSGGHIAGFSDGSLVFFQSTWNTSTAVVLLSGAGTSDDSARVISAADQNSATNRFVQPTLVTFPSPDGKFTLHAQVFESPPHVGVERGAGGRMGIVFTHGGCQRQMYAAVHYSLPYAQLYGLNQHLASAGAVVISVNYRGGPGYGVAFRAANGSGWQGASEYQDVRAAAMYLKGRPDIGSVGIYGLSYGGLNAMQGVSRDSAIFKAAVANAPVVNWIEQKRFDENWPGTGTVFDLNSRHRSEWRTLPEGPSPGLAGPGWFNSVESSKLLAFESSPSAFLHKISSPLLMVQGDSDEEVPFQETIGVVRTLRNLGIPVSTLIFPDETHGLSRFANQLIAANATAAFLFEHLAANIK